MMRRPWALMLIVLFLAVIPGAGCSRGGGDGTHWPTNLDLSFGTFGKVTTDIGLSSSAYSLAIQTDGKIIAAGQSYSSSGLFNFALARYNTDGSLDTTFGTHGIVITNFGPERNGACAVAIQKDGKIVAAGYSSSSSGYLDFALARYNTDGSLDTTFGTGGKVTTDIGYDYESAYAVAIQTDGKIVTAGTGSQMSLVRYNADGSPDAGFGTNGLVITSFGNYSEANAVAIQIDGKIVAAGNNSDDFALARYNADGSLDATFGTGGKVTTDFEADYDSIYAVAIQADGKIVAAGMAWLYTQASYVPGFSSIPAPGYRRFGLARYNSDGSLDTSFGTGGLVATAFGPDQDWAFAVAIQRDGKIVAAGYSYPSEYPYLIYPNFALARYDMNGSLDATFGIGGRVTTDFGSVSSAYALAIQSDGRIVAGGCSAHGFALARYLP